MHNDDLIPSESFCEDYLKKVEGIIGSQEIKQADPPGVSNSSHEGISTNVQWHITARNESGEIVSEELSKNIVVKTGRDMMLRLLFGLSASSFMALGAGACSTTAAVTDTQLNYEHILNGSRKTLTNTSNVALTSSDISDEVFVDGGTTYQKKITVRGKYAFADSNNGQPFREYGLFNIITVPGTPFAVSGVMYNHFVASSNIQKDITIEITVDITIRT